MRVTPIAVPVLLGAIASAGVVTAARAGAITTPVTAVPSFGSTASDVAGSHGERIDTDADPTRCLERHGGSVDDPDWDRFAASRPPVDASGSDEASTSETYIARAAALCIARVAGLDDGDEPWHARLLYLVDERRVVWIVTRTRRTESGGGEHRELFVDAVSGAVRRAMSYTTRPR